MTNNMLPRNLLKTLDKNALCTKPIKITSILLSSDSMLNDLNCVTYVRHTVLSNCNLTGGHI